MHTTPRGAKSRSQLSFGSIGKRSGTPALEYLRYGGPESPFSPSKSFEHVMAVGDDDDLDFELHGDSFSDEVFEGMENVRACCDGKHTVGQHHHHHEHSHAQKPRMSTTSGHLSVAPSEVQRPASPAWSFRSRSRSGSTASHDGMFGGKLRFGSRRSTKSGATTAQD